MATHESRTYQLAKAAILAVLLAVTPVATPLRAQNKPAAAAPAPENKLDALFKKAGKEMEAKKYQAAYDTLTEMEQDVQSSISYAGGKKLMDIRKVNYVTLGGDNAGEHLLM